MTAGARFLTFAAALAISVAFAGPAMAASTYYASPTGGGTECTQAVPCSLPEAVSKATSGDGVVLLPGAYSLSSDLQITRSIRFGGESEMNTTIQTSGSAGIEVNESANATLHDLRLATTESLELKSGAAERVFVDYTGTSTGRSACALNPGASLLDSVCWAHGGSPSAGAIFSESAGGTGNPVTLRNVTAIAANPGGAGIFAEVETAGANFAIDATNVIARGGSRDVWVENGGGATSKATVTLRNSNYASVKEQGPNATITSPGTGGNQNAAAAFVDATAGNFAEAPGSPTIDAGLTEAANGPTALAGESRALPAVCNDTPATDIGAYEFVPAACPPSTTSPTATVQPTPAPSNEITLGKLTKNAKKGTGTLLASVPDAGTLVLTGKGIEKVSRRSSGAAQLKLPIKPVGKAKRRLARTGVAKFKLQLSFVPVGGSVGTATKSVKLTERLG